MKSVLFLLALSVLRASALLPYDMFFYSDPYFYRREIELASWRQVCSYGRTPKPHACAY